MMQDAQAATIALLKRDDDVLALVKDRVWGEKMPKLEASAYARGNVVVRHAPGIAGPGGFLDVVVTTFDVFCYAETPFAAKALHLEVYRALKRARRQVVEDTLIHSYEQVGSARATVDPDTQWDCIISSWKCLSAEEQAT